MSNIKRIEFFNREREKEEIMNILKAEPQLINFVYGPINSGKTTLITNLIENLPENYVVFYINLRGKLIKEYGGFARVLFKVKKKEISENVMEKGGKIAKRAVVLAGRYLSGIPVEKDMLDGFIGKENTEDVFEFLEEYFLKISEERTPILIIDELQVIGDLEIDGKLIYKLFNFFIRLTKELHLCHVFALSSDSLFIERVYSEAMLQGRVNFILVDDFDEETTMKFLKRCNFTEDEINFVMLNVGGKVSFLREMINAKSNKTIEHSAKEVLKLEKSKIKEMMRFVRAYGDKVEIGDKQYGVVYEKVVYEDIIETLSKFIEKDKEDVDNIKDIPKRYLVNKNILFVDPIEDIVKPQSRIDLLAIREILKESR